MNEEIKDTLEYVFSLARAECFTCELEIINKLEDYLINLQQKSRTIRKHKKRSNRLPK